MRSSLRVSRSLLWLIATGTAFAGPLVFGQTGADSPVSASDPYVPTMRFDVASVRQSPPARSYNVSGSFAPHASSLRATNFSAENLLAMAYGVRWDQIAGMPDLRAMFNIQAKGDSTVDARLARLNADQEHLEEQHMLQVLLSERFKLKVHWEARVGESYNLTVSKSGAKAAEAKGQPPNPEESKLWGDEPIPHIYQRGNSLTGFAFVARDCSMEELAQILAVQFAHPISDRTGLTGRYDFTLRYLGTRQRDRSADDMNPLPPLDEALSSQLGLKLDRAKSTAQYLIVDHIEMPSEN